MRYFANSRSMRNQNPPQKSHKILVMLSYWEGDKNIAMQLARLITDCQHRWPGVSDTADFLFVARFDCKHDQSTIEYVAKRFKVHTHTSKHRGTGWPDGCNGILFGGMEFVYHKMAAGQIPLYKAIFNIESDSIPVDLDALQRISRLWDSFGSKICFAGAWLENGVSPGLGHINGGSCLITGDLTFLKWFALRASARFNGGWDYFLAPEFQKRGWEKVSKIRSYYRTQITEDIFLKLREEEILWFHGSKDDAGIKLCRKHLLGQ